MNFNTTPYFDDYDPKSHHYKVLFRPNRPIQARELNAIQGQFFNQLKSFSNHIFKNGSIVSDARISLRDYHTVKITGSISFLKEGYNLVGSISGQKAKFILAIGEVICVTYIGTSNNEYISFTQNEEIDVFDETGTYIGSFYVKNDPEFNSITSIFIVNDGVFYYDGYFVECKRQLMPVDIYQNIDVGLRVIEKIITPADDENILDNNPNPMSYLKPGADRYQITLSLEVRNNSEEQVDEPQNIYETKNGFITLASIRDGKIRFIKSDSEYSDIGDMLAQRTYEESGNYTVKSFKIKLQEHKAKSEIDGFGHSINGKEENYVATLSPGIAYVRGHRIETIKDVNLISSKARDVETKAGFVKQFEPRTYIKAIPRDQTSIYPNSITSTLINDETLITLYDSPLTINNIPQGTVVGTCKVCDLIKDGQTTDTVPKDIYRYYISEININSGRTLSEVEALYSATATFGADPFIDSDVDSFILYNPGNMEFIWRFDKQYPKSLRDIDDPTLGSFTFSKRKKIQATLDSTGKTTFLSPTGEYFKPFNNGTIGILTDIGVNSKVTISSANSEYTPEKLNIDLGASNAGKKLTLILDVTATNMAEKTKELKSTSETFLDPTQSFYSLSKSDIRSLRAFVYEKLTPENRTDVTSHFKLFDGQNDVSYVNGTATIITPITSVSAVTHGIVFEYDYLFHSGNEGYFTVDSYSSMDYKFIPTYKSRSSKQYDLRNCIDFRPLILNSAIQSFATFPVINQLAIFDVTYYVGRVDTVVIKPGGDITMLHGIPKEAPVPLKNSDEYIALYNLWLSPYTFSLSDIKVEYIENRRYTMRDINKIEDRLRAVEYNVALNLLEKSASDMSIKDVDGLDRFKNGFVVDDFGNFQAGDTTSNEFRAAIDPKRKELRPKFTMRSRQLALNTDTSFGYTLIDGMAYFPFESILMDSQPYATKHISINPYYMTSKKGIVTLTPNNDTWSDTTRNPIRQVDIDTGLTDALQNVADYTDIGVVYGEWQAFNSNIRTAPLETDNDTSNVTVTTSTTSQSGVTTTSSATSSSSTQTIQQRTVTGVEISGRTDTYNAGDRVLDVSIDTYMRSIDIEFNASKMLGNTKVYAFFDGKPVSAYCRPIDGLFGDQLKTDSNGNIRGIFRVPEETFFVGKKEFKLTGDHQNKANVDDEFTRAFTSFFGAGINVTKEELALNVVTPEYTDYGGIAQGGASNAIMSEAISSTGLVQTLTTTTTSTTNSNGDVIVTTEEVVENQGALIPGDLHIYANNQRRVINSWEGLEPFPYTGTEFTSSGLIFGDTITRCNLSSSEHLASNITKMGGYSGPINISNAVIPNAARYANIFYHPGIMTVIIMVHRESAGDPIAQSFKFNDDRFITGLDVYFERVDTTGGPIWFQIRTMKNGYPTTTVLGETSYTSAEVAEYADETSKTPFHVDFKFPIYVKGGDDYCFVIGGQSPGTRIWVCKLGDKEVTNPDMTIEIENIVLGSSFRSQNSNTWNAEQFEDIKYNLYGALFLESTMYLDFTSNYETETLELDPFECETGINKIRVYMKDHGANVGDIITLSMFGEYEYIIHSPGGNRPRFDQIISTATGSGKIFDVTTIDSTHFKIKIKELSGFITTGQTYHCDSITVRGIVAPYVTGSFTSAPTDTINGISLDELNGELTVSGVDSAHSFIVNIASTPTGSGRFGGLGCQIACNYRYEIHNSSGKYSAYSCTEEWRFTGIDKSYNAVPEKFINLGTDYHLDNSNLLASKRNEEITGTTSLSVNGLFFSNSVFVSPVVNTTTFSTILVSNTVDSANQDIINVEPNSVGRYQPETHANQGSHSYKYVTKKIILKNPANDIRIAFDVYKDYVADFDVYVKTQEQYNNDNIDDYAWELVSIVNKRNSINLDDRVEYELDCSELVENWDDRSFISFKLKLVGRTTNAAKPPLFQNLRMIAYT